MDPKTAITNGSFCPCPWTGFIMQPDGTIKNCVAATTIIGDVNKTDLDTVLSSELSLSIKKDMLAGIKNNSCDTCHVKEQGNPLRSNIISNRIYYLKELSSTPYSLYDSVENFDLQTIDLRWRNTCNFACIYCDPINSSKLASELGVSVHIDSHSRKQVLDYAIKNVKNLKHVYLAGGEPFMITDNQILLDCLLEQNPDVNLRVNTNLSNTDTKIFETLCKFKNVHWIISIDEMRDEFEYVRYGGCWTDFVSNLEKVSKLNHKISFNMLWHVLNPFSLFDCIDWLLAQGFHKNSLVLGPVTGPAYLDVNNLPEHVCRELEQLILTRVDANSSWLVEHGYQLLLDHLKQPFNKNLSYTRTKLSEIDQRRNVNSQQIFPWLYKL